MHILSDPRLLKAASSVLQTTSDSLRLVVEGKTIDYTRRLYKLEARVTVAVNGGRVLIDITPSTDMMSFWVIAEQYAKAPETLSAQRTADLNAHVALLELIDALPLVEKTK